MARFDLLHGLQSFQDMLLPIFEVECTLCRLRDTQYQLSTAATVLQEEHPEASQALREACGKIQRAIAYFHTQRWLLTLAFRSKLQNINRATGSLPTMDVSEHHAG
eukprot:s3717_g8.t1